LSLVKGSPDVTYASVRPGAPGSKPLRRVAEAMALLSAAARTCTGRWLLSVLATSFRGPMGAASAAPIGRDGCRLELVHVSLETLRVGNPDTAVFYQDQVFVSEPTQHLADGLPVGSESFGQILVRVSIDGAEMISLP
jgi:hypothetical protein